MTVTKVSPQICEALRIGKYWNGKTKWSHLHELLLLKATQEEETAPVQWWPLRKHHVTVRRKRNPFQQEWTNNGTSLCEDGDPLISCEDERERKSQEKHAEAFTSVWMRAATLCWGNVGLYKPKLMICALLRWNRNSEAGLKCYCELRRFKFPFSGTKISYLLNINIRDMLSFSSVAEWAEWMYLSSFVRHKCLSCFLQTTARYCLNMADSLVCRRVCRGLTTWYFVSFRNDFTFLSSEQRCLHEPPESSHHVRTVARWQLDVWYLIKGQH